MDARAIMEVAKRVPIVQTASQAGSVIGVFRFGTSTGAQRRGRERAHPRHALVALHRHAAVRVFVQPLFERLHVSLQVHQPLQLFAQAMPQCHWQIVAAIPPRPRGGLGRGPF